MKTRLVPSAIATLLVSAIMLVPLTASAQWQIDGVAICAAANSQQFPAIVPDGSWGGIVTWKDDRSGSTDIYAQRVDASGVAQGGGEVRYVKPMVHK